MCIRDSRQLPPIQRPPPAQPIHKQDSREEQRCLRPNKGAAPHNEPTEKPKPHGARKITSLSNEIELIGRRMQEDEDCQRGQKRCEHLRERHSRVVRRKRAEDRQPKCCDGDSATDRFAGSGRKPCGYACGQNACRKINECLRHKYCVSPRACQGINDR